MNLSQHNRSCAAPAGGASTVSLPIDHSSSELGAVAQNVLYYVKAPSLTATQLPSGQTLTYTLVESNNADLSSPISSTVMGVQTGTGSTVPGTTFAAFPALAGGRYHGLKLTASSTAAIGAVNVTLGAALTVQHA